MKSLNIVLIAVLMLSVTAMSFAMAAGQGASGNIGSDDSGSDDSGSNGSGAGEGVETQLVTQNQASETGLQNQVRVQSGKYSNEAGEQMEIQSEGERTRLKVGNVEAASSMVMTHEQAQNKTKLKVQLSNGKKAEVKIMPNTASETALTRLRAKCEVNNCTIELKEVGSGNQTRAAYEIKTQKEAKVFGFIKAQMRVQAQIDAENGEVIQTKKSWWAFLASESDESAVTE